MNLTVYPSYRIVNKNMIWCNLIFYKVTSSKKHENAGSGGVFGDQILWEGIKMNSYDNLKISKTYVHHICIYS